jgi:hypothetical protein
VTIAGTNFINVISVTIGARALDNGAVVSTTEITGTTPVGAAPGPKDVVVAASLSRGTCTGCFTYLSGPPAAPGSTAGR